VAQFSQDYSFHDNLLKINFKNTSKIYIFTCNHLDDDLHVVGTPGIYSFGVVFLANNFHCKLNEDLTKVKIIAYLFDDILIFAIFHMELFI